MSLKQRLYQQKISHLLGALIGGSLVACLELVPVSLALPNNQSLFQIAVQFEPPNNGAPGNRKDMGRRDSCEKPLLALIPQTNWGETIAERPTFWLHVPNRGTMRLVLRDEKTKAIVYESTFQVADRAGIAGFPLAATAPPLEIDRRYRAQFYFLCNPEKSSDFLYVHGVVVRRSISSEFNTQLAKALPQERVELLAKNGFWFDTLTELIQLRLTAPQNNELVTAWTELLRHPIVRLDEIISEPLLPCCTPDSLVDNP